MKIKNITFILIPLLLFTACESDYLDINTDPNDPTDAPPELIFPYGLAYTAYHVGGDLNIAGAFFAQQWANGTGQYRAIDQYDQTQSDGQNSFNELYYGALRAFEDVIIRADRLEGDGDIYAGTSKIMKAYVFSVLADLYGDIPFENALRGSDILQPVPTSQSNVYSGIQSLLDEAIGQLQGADENDISWGVEDHMYGSDLSKWIKFANSLKLRLFMRLSEKDPSTAANGFASVISSGAPIMSSLDDNALVYFGAESINNNHPISQSYTNAQTINPSALIINFLQDNNDPRLSIFATENDATDQPGTYFGTPNGATTNEIPLNDSYLGNNFFGAGSFVALMTFEEVLFLRAEAAARGWIIEDDQALYEAGIAISMARWELNVPVDYLTDEDIAYPSSGSINEKWEKIYTQKWLALFGQGVEMFSDARRASFRFPAGISPALNSLLAGGGFPQRLVYPVAEHSSNSNIEVIPMSVKVWFADF